MRDFPSTFESDLRVSANWISTALFVLGMIVGVMGGFVVVTWVELLAVLLLLVAAAGWWLYAWQPWAGRWFIILAITALLISGALWLRMPAILVLLAIPVALATVLISLLAGLATAASLTLLLALPLAGVGGPEAPWIAVVGIWSILGILFCATYPVRQVASWSWEYYRRAQQQLDEARSRKAELEQALADLVHANRQISLANERMALLRRAAEEARRQKEAFIARVSHEFRAPLNIIIGMISLMIENPKQYGGRFPRKAWEHLRIVYANCQHLSSMINDVLDLSQADAGRLTLHRTEADLREIVESSVTVVRPWLEEKGLALHVTMPDDLPPLSCDRVRIRQVILNLLSNAARFTEKGHVSIEVSHRNGHALIKVADTGPGIPPEDLQRIFEPFAQGSGDPLRTKGGSGLGLSISKQFVELHGGRIWVESQVGSGTAFFVKLPISAPEEPAARPGHWIKEEWLWMARKSGPRLPEGQYRPRIVVYDRDGDLCQILTRRYGEIEFVETHSMPQAVEALRQCPAQALVINTGSPAELWGLVDQAREQVSDTPIIGCAYPPRLAQALKAGAAGFVAKPVTRPALAQAMARVGRPVRRVLVVDDEADAREMMAWTLRACQPDLEVISADGGAAALQMLRTHRPDLVLLDMVMPEVDGWQVLAAQQADEALRDIPVVIVSGQDMGDGVLSSQMVLATTRRGLGIGSFMECVRSLSKALLEG
jgi:signal transduction histidine kinase/CheY-like chemotaxis protein